MKTIRFSLAMLGVLLLLGACQQSGGGGATGGASGDGPIAFQCATLSDQACVSPAAPLRSLDATPPAGALQIAVGNVSLSTASTTHFSVTITRALQDVTTDWFTAALVMEAATCNAVSVPASGWEWVDLWSDGFGNVFGDKSQTLARHAIYGFSCPTLALGPHTAWAILASDTGSNGTIYNGWIDARTANLAPTDPTISSVVAHTAVLTFTVVP